MGPDTGLVVRNRVLEKSFRIATADPGVTLLNRISTPSLSDYRMSVMADGQRRCGLGRELRDLLCSDATAIGSTPAAEHVSVFSIIFSTHPAQCLHAQRFQAAAPPSWAAHSHW